MQRLMGNRVGDSGGSTIDSRNVQAKSKCGDSKKPMDKDKMWCDCYNKPKHTSHVFEAI